MSHRQVAQVSGLSISVDYELGGFGGFDGEIGVVMFVVVLARWAEEDNFHIVGIGGEEVDEV